MSLQRLKDKLRPASFRGVRFLIDNVSLHGGRAGPDHEFPDRDEPYAEDTGRKQRKWPVDAYLVGPDSFAAKKKLQQALEKKGAGDLVHPYYGRQRVVVREFEITERTAAMGFIQFRIEFVEAGSLLFPKTNADRAFLVGLAGSVLGESAANALTGAFNVADEAQFVVDSATDKLLDISGKMDSISAGITSAADPLAEFAFAVRNIRSSATDLILSPVALAKNIADAFGLLVAAVGPEKSFDFHRGFFGFGLLDAFIPQTTDTRTRQVASLSALNQFMRATALAGAAAAATGMSFKSFEDATATRDLVTNEIDSLMAVTSSDDVYASLQDLRAQLTQAVPDENQNLAHIAEVTPTATMPSLVLAYNLYGSVDQEQDIIDRNNIVHPGFVPGGSPLEVLDSG